RNQVPRGGDPRCVHRRADQHAGDKPGRRSAHPRSIQDIRKRSGTGMKLTIIGGGGFRVPQIFEALAGENEGVHITELCLFDSDPARVTAIEAVLEQMAPALPRPPSVVSAATLDEAVSGAAFIFSAMRIGGTEGRIKD